MPEPEYDENGYAILHYPEDAPPLHEEEEGGEGSGYMLEAGKAINITTTGVGLSGLSTQEMKDLESLVLTILKQLQKTTEDDGKIGFKT